MTIFRRLRYVFRQRQIEAEIAEEIETHRLMAQERERSSGASSQDAAGASYRSMGNITLAREDARAAWIAPWIESAWQDVAYALRTFRRAPAFMPRWCWSWRWASGQPQRCSPWSTA